MKREFVMFGRGIVTEDEYEHYLRYSNEPDALLQEYMQDHPDDQIELDLTETAKHHSFLIDHMRKMIKESNGKITTRRPI